jgi:hypothetical protein
MLKLGIATITFGRPKTLGRLIAAFESQTYQNREMVILDDGGQYPSCPRGDRWRVVSIDKRFSSLGEKRRACVNLLTNCGGFASIDDDDMILPFAIEAIAYGLRYKMWVQASESYEWDGKEMTRIKTHPANPFDPHRSHHGAWAYRMNAYRAAGEYIAHDEDSDLQRRMIANFGPSGDTICPEYPEPHLIYSREPDTRHISNSYHSGGGFEDAWKSFGEVKPEPTELKVAFDRDYFSIPRPGEASPRPW